LHTLVWAAERVTSQGCLGGALGTTESTVPGETSLYRSSPGLSNSPRVLASRMLLVAV